MTRTTTKFQLDNNVIYYRICTYGCKICFWILDWEMKWLIKNLVLSMVSFMFKKYSHSPVWNGSRRIYPRSLCESSFVPLSGRHKCMKHGEKQPLSRVSTWCRHSRNAAGSYTEIYSLISCLCVSHWVATMLFGTSHRTEWEIDIQTIVTIGPNAKTIELRVNKFQRN